MGRVETPPSGAGERDAVEAIRSFIESAHRDGILSDDLRTTLLSRIEVTTGEAPSRAAAATAPEQQPPLLPPPTPDPALARLRESALAVEKRLIDVTKRWPGTPPLRLVTSLSKLQAAYANGTADELDGAVKIARRSLEITLEAAPAPPARKRRSEAAPTRPAAPAAPARPPATTPPPPPAPSPPAPPPARPAAPPSPLVPPPRPRRKTEIWARFARIRMKRTWSALTADFAANTLTYLGVLLAVVVIYAFFAFGYFGDLLADDNRQYRMFAFIGVVAFFLGVAWLLRTRSGIPQTATAIEVIGVVLIPVMMAATVRDWCGPSDYWWCVPDYDGPQRWAAYGVVGALAVVIYAWFAARRRLYAYFVGPMLWVTVGALGLFLEDGLALIADGDRPTWAAFAQDGISGPQLIAVLAALAITVAVAQRLRTSRLGGLLAVPTMRVGLLAAPVVLVVGVVFAYNDAVVGGTPQPGLADLAWPNTIATAIAAIVFAIGANARFAWETFSDRMQRDIGLVLRVLAYLSLATAWVLSVGFGVSPAWLGVGFLAYAGLIAAVDRRLGGTDVAGLWIARTSGVVGATMSLLEPVAALVAWGGLTLLAVGRSLAAPVRTATARYVPLPDGEGDRIAELWVPALVAAGAGAARIGWPDATPWVLAAIAVAMGATRFLPAAARDLRTFSGGPAIAAGAAALIVEIGRRVVDTGMPDAGFGGLLLLVALAAALVDVPLSGRVSSSTALGTAGVLVLVRSLVDGGPRELAWADTSVLAAVGLGWIGVTLLRPRSSTSLLPGALGHTAVVLATARSFGFEETALFGLGVLALAHIAEIVAAETGRAGTFRTLADRMPERRTLLEAIPATVVALALPPMAILTGRRVPWIRSERARFGPVLAAVSWLYATGTMQRRVPMRRLLAPLAYLAAFAALAVAVPSTTATLTAAWSAAAVTALLAATMRRPHASIVSWLAGVAAATLTASRLGVADRDLHFVLHVAAVTLVAGPALVLMRGERSTGIANPWLRPPAALGLVGLPATVALAMADPRGLTIVALSAAAAYAALGWATRTGGLSLPSLAMAAVGYGWTLYDTGIAHPFDEPLVWMPAAAAAVALSGVLPGRRSWRMLEDPAPGALVAGLGLAAVATVLAVPAGVVDQALLIAAALLAMVWWIRRSDPWLAAAAVSLVASGLIAGDYWAPAATAATALVTAVVADHQRSRPLGTVLQWLAIAWLAVTFWELDAWRNWSDAELTAAAAIAAGLFVVPSTFLFFATGLPDRARRWVLPLQGLGQAAAVTAMVVATTTLTETAAFGVAAGITLAEAALVGLVGTVRRDPLIVAGSAVLIGVAYATGTQWLEWTGGTLMARTGFAAAALLAVVAALYVVDRVPERIWIWRFSLQFLAHLGAFATLQIAYATQPVTTTNGAISLMVLAEAGAAGIVGTARRSASLVHTSSALVTLGAAFGLAWLDLEPAALAGTTAGAGAVLLVAWLAMALLPQLPARAHLWRIDLLALSQVSAAAAVFTAWDAFSVETAAGVTAGILGFEAMVAGGVATVRRDPVLAAASTAGLIAAYGFGAQWLTLTTDALIQVTGFVAVAVLGVWTVTMLPSTVPDRVRLWRPSLLAAAQLGILVVVMAAWAGVETSPAAGVTAVLLGIDAAVAGLIGTLRMNRVAAGIAAGLGSIAYGCAAVWLDAGTSGFVTATGLGAVVLLALWFAGWVRSTLPPRLELWMPSLLAVGHAGSAATMIAATLGFTTRDAWGVAALVIGYEALLVGAVGTARRRQDVIWIGVLLIAVAAGAAAAWTGLDAAALTGLFGIEAAAVACIATVMSRFGDDPEQRLRLWVFPLHALALFGAFATGLFGAQLGGGRALWIGAVVCAGVGAYLSLNAWSLPQTVWVRESAGASFVSSAALAAAWQVEYGTAVGPIVFGVAALGVIAAAWSGALHRAAHPWRRSAAVMGAGFSAVALVATGVEYGPSGEEFAGAVLLAGAALAAHGILARSLIEVEAAIVAWLAALLIILQTEITLSIHLAVVITSVGLLSVIEIERFRRRSEGLGDLAALHHAEWVLMLAPPTLAAVEMLDISRLWMGLIMCAEGAVLLGWGALTEVRRRALLGAGVMTLSILLGLIVPAIEGVGRGLTGGTWLVIGAVAAVVFITAGSTIERYRTRIGQRLARLGDILEHWE